MAAEQPLRPIKERWQTFTMMCTLCGALKRQIRVPYGGGFRVWKVCDWCDTDAESRHG